MRHIILIIIAVLSLPLIIILGNALQVSFETSGELSSYLRYGEGDVSKFSAEEQEHLVEVKDFYSRLTCIFAIAVIVLITSFLLLYLIEKNSKSFGMVFLFGGILTLLCMIVIYLLAKNWDSAFANFHQMFFHTQWQFPEGSLLIKMFPEQLFYNAFKKIIASSLLSSFGCIVLGLFLVFKNRIRALQP